MYRPSLRPGEELVKTSPGVNVKNVPFDAFLTSKRIIFVKQTDSLQERKELVFPLNLVRDFQPSSDESGTPAIRFSIEKPSGEVGDLILKFIQTGDYRYAERDDWIEDLKSVSRGVVPRHAAGGQKPFPEEMPPRASPPSYAAHNRDADLFGAGPEVHSPPSPEYRQPPPVSHADDWHSAPQDFGQPPRPQSHAEDRDSVPQNFRQPSPAPQASSSNPVAGGTKPVFCRFCGAKVPPGSVFCPSCGGKQEQQPEMHRQSFSESSSRPQAAGRQPFSPPPPPAQRHSGYGDNGFVSPPPPSQSRESYGQQHGYPPRDGGMSLADDRAYGSESGGQMSPKRQKSMMKEQAKADKARMKEQARAEKGRQKAMKKSQKGGGYGYDDPYGYKESRLPEPKIIIIAVAVIAVIAVAGYAFSSGMIGGDTNVGSQAGSTQTPSSSSSGSTGSSANVGSTTTSETYGNWYFGVFYPGEWSGTYTVNGQTTTITDNSGESEIYGSKPTIQLGTFSGTVEITANILDEGSGGTLSVYLYNDKGVEVDNAQASVAGRTAILTYP